MYFPFSKKDNNFWFLPQYPFYCFNNQLNYVDIFRGQTFILSERLIPKYLIDFGKKQMPFKIRNNKVLFFENQNNYAYLTNEFLENDNYLQFSYHWGKDIFNCIYFKKNDMTIRIKNSYNWHERVPALFIKPSYAKTNYFVSILSNIQCLKMKKISEKLNDQQLKNVVSNFDLGDNPILIMYFLK